MWYKFGVFFLSCVLWSGHSYFETNTLTVNIHLLSFAVSRQVTKCLLLLLKLLCDCVPSEFLHILDVIINVIINSDYLMNLVLDFSYQNFQIFSFNIMKIIALRILFCKQMCNFFYIVRKSDFFL